MKRLGILGLAVVLVMGLAAGAGAVNILTETHSFVNITNNNPGDVAIGLEQLFVDVVGDLDGGTTAQFHFYNVGPDASSITQIFFMDGALLNIASITNGVNVDYRYANPQPGNLPGGNTVGFVPTVGFSVEPSPPTQPNGVGPGEHVDILFNLQPTMTFSNVLAYLANDGLRIGIHVQGFASRGSESFENNGTQVPEPSTLLLLGFGLAGVGLYRRMRG